MSELYKDPILQKIVETIQANTKRIKTYFYGDPFLIAKSSLPALAVAKDTTSATDFTTAEDQHFIGIAMTLVTDIKADFNKDPDMVVGYNTLYEICEGRDTDYTLKDDTLLYILRHNEALASSLTIDLDSTTDIDYGLTVGKRGENVGSTEAIITFRVHFAQLR